MSDQAAPAPEPVPSPAAAPGPVPGPAATPPTSASMLAYAYAHKVAPPPARLMPSKPVPCAGPDVHVSRNDLAVILLHVAMWDLQRRGRIRLEDVEKKVLFVKQHALKVRVMPGATPEGEVADSLEYDLLRAAVGASGEGDVRDVVRRLYPGDVEDPYARALAMANPALIAAGVIRLDVEERSGLGRLRGGKKETLMWQCDRVGALVSAYNAFVADWVRDRDSNRAEYDRLHKEIDRAIASRKKEHCESILDVD